MTSFRILDTTFELHAPPAELVVWLEAEWRFPYAPQAGSEKRILACPLSATPAREGKRETLHLHDTTVTLYRQETGLLLEWRGGVLHVSISAHEANIAYLGPTPEVALLFRVAVSEALRTWGYVPLHASVVARDDQAITFLGPSGRGKTTTLLHALGAGYRVVAEDYAWFDPRTAALYGWDRHLRMLPDTYARFKHLLGQHNAVVQAGKHTLNYETLGWAERTPKRWTTLVRLERAPDEASSWSSLSPQGAAMALWEASGMPILHEARQYSSAVIAQLLASLQLRTLRVGRSPLPL